MSCSLPSRSLPLSFLLSSSLPARSLPSLKNHFAPLPLLYPRQTAVSSFRHLLAIRLAACLSSLVLPCPFLPASTTTEMAVCESLSINSLLPMLSRRVSAIAVTSASQTVALSPKPLPPEKSLQIAQPAPPFPSPSLLPFVRAQLWSSLS